MHPLRPSFGCGGAAGRDSAGSGECCAARRCVALAVEVAAGAVAAWVGFGLLRFWDFGIAILRTTNRCGQRGKRGEGASQDCTLDSPPELPWAVQPRPAGRVCPRSVARRRAHGRWNNAPVALVARWPSRGDYITAARGTALRTATAAAAAAAAHRHTIACRAQLRNGRRSSWARARGHPQTAIKSVRCCGCGLSIGRVLCGLRLPLRLAPANSPVADAAQK